MEIKRDSHLSFLITDIHRRLERPLGLPKSYPH
jgi:hypothetical protein